MGSVHNDYNELIGLIDVITAAMNNIDSTYSTINRKCQQLGSGWNDAKYKELEQIVQDSNVAFRSLKNTLLQGNKYLIRLAKQLMEYESVNLGTGGTYGESVSQILQRPTPSELAANNIKKRLNAVGVQNVELGNIPLTVQEKIVNAFERMAMIFPESKGMITTLIVSDQLEEYMPASTGFSINQGILSTDMNVNPDWFCNSQLTERISACTSSGQWSGEGISSIISHEIGHVLHLQLDALDLGISIGKPVEPSNPAYRELRNRWCNSCTTNNMRDSMLSQMGLSRDDICTEISDYADYDGSECFAECVSDVTTSDNPSQLSVNIINEYRRRLRNFN